MSRILGASIMTAPFIKKIERYVNKLRGRAQAGSIALHQYKAIYFPIPKVACSSIMSSCATVLGIQEGPDTDIHRLYFPSVSADEIYKYSDYFKFAFVRNPWDRLLSCYVDKIKADPNLNNGRYINGVARSFSRYNQFHAGMSYEEFVDVILEWPDETANHHFKSQYTFLCDSNGKLVIDYAGRFEFLADHFEYICKHSKIPIERLPHRQKSSHKNYKDFYTDELIEKVAKRYQKDIELFNYTFD